MCFILKSVFCSTSVGQYEFKGLDQWLLKCSVHPPQGRHFAHPATSLTPESHRVILRQIYLDATTPACLMPMQFEAFNLAESDHGTIFELRNTAFVFLPRWIESGSVHRELNSRGNEMSFRVDGILDAKLDPIEINLESLRSAGKDFCDTSLNFIGLDSGASVIPYPQERDVVTRVERDSSFSDIDFVNWDAACEVDANQAVLDVFSDSDVIGDPGMDVLSDPDMELDDINALIGFLQGSETSCDM